MTETRSAERRGPRRLFFFLTSVVFVILIIMLIRVKEKPIVQNLSIAIQPSDSLEDLVKKAVAVRPSSPQFSWQELEFQAFVHFGINTFTDLEWGTGDESPSLFNPTEFDADQWVQAFKAAGIKGVILTAKHHDGFCLWPSRYTKHSVAASPWKEGKGDIVQEVSLACRRGGLKFGIYVSPWDRHESSYGDSPRYNKFFKNQLRELLTNYGEISEVWFDGACGEGPNGRYQVYDWHGYWALIRELQPEAVISIIGPDARWVGNEAGSSRDSEWSVIPVAQMDDTPASRNPGGIAGINAQAVDLGSIDAIASVAQKGGRLIWYPAQVDVSIRPGWFFHASENDKVKTLDELMNIYFASVGNNSQLLLNVPADQRGRIHEADVERLKELGEALGNTFSLNMASSAKAISSCPTAPGFEARLTLDGNVLTSWLPVADNLSSYEIIYELPRLARFNMAMIQENIRLGQRIESFALDVWLEKKTAGGQREKSGQGQSEVSENAPAASGNWLEVTRGTTAGWKKLVRFDEVESQKVRLRIARSRLAPAVGEFGLFFYSGAFEKKLSGQK